MTGKELADKLSEAINAGTPGDDPTMCAEIVEEASKLSTDEMWRFVFAVGTQCKTQQNSNAYFQFNGEAIKSQSFKDALHAMHGAPRPPDLTQGTT